MTAEFPAFEEHADGLGERVAVPIKWTMNCFERNGQSTDISLIGACDLWRFEMYIRRHLCVFVC